MFPNPILQGIQNANALSDEMIANKMNQLKLNAMPQQMQAELAQKQAQAALTGQTAQYYAPNIQSEIALRQGQLSSIPSEIASRQANTAYTNALLQSVPTDIAFKAAQLKKQQIENQFPLLNMPGTAGQIGSFQYLQATQPSSALSTTPSQQFSLVDTMKKGLESNISAKNASAAYNQARTQGYNFQQMPVNFRGAMLAQGAGMGIEPTEMTKLLSNGQTMEQIATTHGFDPTNMPEPIYPLTAAGQNQLKQRQVANQELNVLASKITDAVGPYAQTIGGMSPLQIGQALTGKNKEEQAKFLAARALVPELIAIRIRMMQGQVGVEALRELTNTSLLNVKAYQSLVTPEIFKRSNKLVEQWLNETVETANKKATKYLNTDVNQTVNRKTNESINIPTFKNKTEFQTWYRNLSIDQQNKYKQQFG